MVSRLYSLSLFDILRVKKYFILKFLQKKLLRKNVNLANSGYQIGNVDGRVHDATATFVVPLFEAFNLNHIVERLHRDPKKRLISEIENSRSKFVPKLLYCFPNYFVAVFWEKKLVDKARDWDY